MKFPTRVVFFGVFSALLVLVYMKVKHALIQRKTAQHRQNGHVKKERTTGQKDLPAMVKFPSAMRTARTLVIHVKNSADQTEDVPVPKNAVLPNFNGPDDGEYPMKEQKITNAREFEMMLMNKAAETSAWNPAVVMTIVDTAYQEMLVNYLLCARKAGVTNILPIVLNKEAQEYFKERGIYSYYEPSMESLGKYETKFGTREFYYKVHFKYKAILHALESGVAVLYTDVDTAILKNPFKYMTCKACDLEIQKDYRRLMNLCVGIMLIRPTPKGIAFVKDLVHQHELRPAVADQPEFNQRAHKAHAEGKLTMKPLHFIHFPTGYEFFYRHYTDTKAFRDVVIYHNNWTKIFRRKRYRAKELGIWFIDDNMYYSNMHGKYIVYENSIKELHTYEISALYTAVRLAKHLNRVLILPTFTCPKNGSVDYCMYKRDKCACSLEEVTDVEKFDIMYEGVYREHMFLSRSLVPKEVKKSISPELIIESAITKRYSHSFEKVAKLTPKDFTGGATSQEILTWLRNYEHFSVLCFHSMYGQINL